MRKAIWLSVLCLCVLVTSSDWAKSEIPCAPDFVGVRGMLRGHVYADDTGIALEYANIVATKEVHGSDSSAIACGGLSGPAGEFSIDLPPGTYTFQVIHFGYRRHVTEGVKIRAGDDVSADAYLMPVGLSLRESAAESLGVDLARGELDLRMMVTPDRPEFERGDQVRLSIAIHNQGEQAVVLPETIDGSGTGSRYPIVQIDVDGPPAGFTKHKIRTHGNVRRLEAASLHVVLPGETFDATPGWRTLRLQDYVEFLEPGLYSITVRFLMDEPDLRRWWGLLNPGPVPPDVSERLRRVPLVDLAASIELRVK